MSLKNYMIILITLMSLIALSCVDVPATAPELTKTLEDAKAKAAEAKTDEVTDLKTIEENTEATENVELKNKQEEK